MMFHTFKTLRFPPHFFEPGGVFEMAAQIQTGV